MTDPAHVPPVGDDWIAARRDRLVAEVARTPTARHRLSRRRVVSGFGALAVAGAASIAGVLIAGGPAASNAFAGWTAAPTQPASGELSDAVAQCKSGPATPPPGAATRQVGPGGGALPGTSALQDTANWQLAVSDVRGPFSMLLFTDGDNTSILCVDGPTFQSRSSEMAAQGTLTDDAISIDRFSTTVNPQAGAYTFVEGRVGASVTAAVLVLDDGTSIDATIHNGRFLAWWPGAHTVKSTAVTTASATTTQPASLPSGPAGPGLSTGSSSQSGLSCVIDGKAQTGSACPPAPSAGGASGGAVTTSGGGPVQVQGESVQIQGSSAGGASDQQGASGASGG
jgi:hypothetical protein